METSVERPPPTPLAIFLDFFGKKIAVFDGFLKIASKNATF